MSFLAVPWFVLAITGSATTTGVVASSEMAPYVVVQALGGPLIDRLGPAGSLSPPTWARRLPSAPYRSLHAVGSLPLPMLALLVAVAGALRGAGDTARYVLVPVLAQAAWMPLERAAGLYDGVARLASLIGAPLAGVLIAISSSVTVLAVDAVTFALSAIAIATTVSRGVQGAPTPHQPTRPRYLSALAEGFRYLRGDRLLLGIALMVLITNTLDQAQGAVLTPVWATDVARSPIALGLIGGAFALGAVLGNAAVTWLGPRAPRRLTYGLGFVLAGAPRLVALAIASTVSPVLPIAFRAGLGAGGSNPILGAAEYERVPPELQARVLGAVGAAAWAGIPIGSLSAGVLIEWVGLRATLWIAAALYLVTTLAPFVFPSWRGMNRAAGPTD